MRKLPFLPGRLVAIAVAITGALAVAGWAAELVSYERLLKSDAEPPTG